MDVYSGALQSLVTVEVEFESEETSRAFSPPAWFGRELTGDVRYSNQQMARKGLPG
jgi:CYTH domain-containing protein